MKITSHHTIDFYLKLSYLVKKSYIISYLVKKKSFYEFFYLYLLLYFNNNT